MSIGLLSLSLGLFGSIVVIVLVVVFANALGKSRNAGRTLLSMLAAFLILLIVFVGFAGMFWVGRSATVRHEAATAQTEAQTQVEHAQAMAEQTRRQIEAQAADIQARVQSGTTPGDRVIVENPPAARDAPQVAQTSPGLTVAGRPWTDAVEEHQDFEADVYPSLEAAAEALGRRVGQKLVGTPDTGGKPAAMVYVWRDGVAGHTENQGGGLVVTREILESVAAGLRQKLEAPAYVSVEQPPTPDDIAVNVAVPEVSFENHNRWRTHAESRSGSIALRVRAPGGPFSISTRFADTPWINDRTGFAGRYANGDWLVAYSDGTHTTHEGAREDAVNAATDVLLPLAQARVSQMSAPDQHRFAQQMEKDPDWLRNRIADELVSRNLVTDRFAQRFDRPYGTVWREAVLVDASPTRVEAIARSLVRGVDAKVAYQRNTWFSFIALAGLIFGTYLFLNMATKGYYAWMLRLAAVAGAGGVVLLFMYLA